jgi:hypothetical protein
LDVDGESREQLVMVPAQFKATGSSTPTVGIERLYTALQFEVYHAPFTMTDFIAPSIWQVSATNTTTLRFGVRVKDDSGQVARVVILYRSVNSNVWQKTELTYYPSLELALGSVPAIGEPVEYIAQAVDPTGNVSLALDHGDPFTVEASNRVYLPLVVR